MNEQTETSQQAKPWQWNGQQWVRWNGTYWEARPVARDGPQIDPPARKVARPVLGWAILAAGLGIVLGTLLPWASALGGVISVSGTGSDLSLIMFVAAVLVLLAGWLVRRGRGDMKVIFLGLVPGVIAAGSAAYQCTKIHTGGAFGVSLGVGLPMIITAGLVAAVASVIGLVRPVFKESW